MAETTVRSKTLKMIVAIVQRGKADVPVNAAIKAGAPAATVLFGRGQGMRERLGPLGIAIQPEKEVILVILEEWLCDQVLSAMVKAGRLDQPGVGFVFVVPVDRALGFVEAQETSK
ncbi:MAG TPA: P-II family nitrogen regulator [bacterium]|nr:P-II family nitrogen regulator [bacterium]